MSLNSFSVATYNPKDVTLTFGGYVISDWDEVVLEKEEPTFKQYKGIDGRNTRVYNPDKSCKLRVKVLQTGLANAILSEVHRLDIQHKSARLEIMLRDLSGDSLFHTTSAYITKYPDVIYSGAFEWREWEIACDDYTELFVSGNEKPNSPILNAIANGIDRVRDIF